MLQGLFFFLHTTWAHCWWTSWFILISNTFNLSDRFNDTISSLTLWIACQSGARFLLSQNHFLHQTPVTCWSIQLISLKLNRARQPGWGGGTYRRRSGWPDGSPPCQRRWRPDTDRSRRHAPGSAGWSAGFLQRGWSPGRDWRPPLSRSASTCKEMEDRSNELD